MSEAQEQSTFVEWCDWNRVPVYHVPNGGSRNPAEAANLKRQGVKPGVPDLCIPVPADGYHGLYIEMKYGRNKLTKEQRGWMDTLMRNGYMCFVCYSAERAIEATREYLRHAGDNRLGKLNA